MNTQSQVIDNIMAQSMKVLRGYEESNVEALVAGYSRAQLDILRQVEQVIAEQGGAWDLSTMRMMNRDRALFDAINARLADLNIETNQTISDALTQQYKMSAERTGYMLDMATPVIQPVILPALPIPAITALVNTPYEGAVFSQRIGVISDAMASDIRDELLQSMINGESMTEAGDRIAGVIGADDLDNPESYAYRSKMIARTEIMRAQNMGRQGVYDDNEDIMSDSPKWLVTPDNRLCPSCLRREGLTKEEIEKASAKNDPFGKKSFPPLHPHCRCTLTPSIKTWRELGIDMPEEMDDEARGMRDPITGRWITQSIQKFEDWRIDRAGQLGLDPSTMEFI